MNLIAPTLLVVGCRRVVATYLLGSGSRTMSSPPIAWAKVKVRVRVALVLGLVLVLVLVLVLLLVLVLVLLLVLVLVWLLGLGYTGLRVYGPHNQRAQTAVV